MGGGKSTTVFVAEYFFSLAGGLVITISSQLLNFTSCTIILLHESTLTRFGLSTVFYL